MPPSVVFVSLGVNSVKLTLAGSAIMRLLYLIAESTNILVESPYALIGVFKRAAESTAALIAADDLDVFARWPSARALDSRSFFLAQARHLLHRAVADGEQLIVVRVVGIDGDELARVGDGLA